jgi:ketosteroid isomerase-like protein
MIQYICLYKPIKIMKKLSFAFIICLLFAGNTFAQTKDEKEVAVVVETMRKAMIGSDKATLTKIAADDLSYGHSSGTIQDKATFVDAIVSGKSVFVTIDLTDQTIKVVGNTAIVRHKLFAKTNDNGTPGSTNLGVLLIWQKQAGEWKLLARQAYKI